MAGSEFLRLDGDMTVYYSAVQNAFYPDELKKSYISAGSWPDDAVLVDDSLFNEFVINPAPAGKCRVAGSDGMPAWADIPPPSHDDLIAYAAREKSQMLIAANLAIAPLQDATDLGMATDDEQAQLLAWKKYRVLLTRVDTSTAPNIEWPALPASD